MKKTTLSSITSGLGVLIAINLFQFLDDKFSDTVQWTIVFFVLLIINYVPTLFIKTIDDSEKQKAFRKNHPTILFLFIALFVFFGLFTMFTIVSTGSINNGIFNLASGIAALGLSGYESYKIIAKK
ncbi:hypothetical protein OIT44_00240 [Weissella ceti]|uniref:Uncharacterized protein n=1 Tax=Weissella ceti TaxID=759620 RepID=A0ABT3E2P4_9LACO|nr:hypothetical protein [Weissella ceti]MCW0952524.1 hypothetical protein [Weissella ceti]QVK11809.1 hypothetical protein KHQ31_06230 [Weissella ceti]